MELVENSVDWAGFSLFEDSGEKMENGFEATAAESSDSKNSTCRHPHP